MVSNKSKKRSDKFYEADFPDRKAAHWRKKGVAFINDAVYRLDSYEIITLEPEGKTETNLVVAGQDSNGNYRKRGSERLSLNWQVREIDSRNQDFGLIARHVVQLAGIPDPNTHQAGREDRPYDDILFLNGHLEVKAYENGSYIEKFDLGKVVGLTIVSTRGFYPVWGPNPRSH